MYFSTSVRLCVCVCFCAETRPQRVVRPASTSEWLARLSPRRWYRRFAVSSAQFKGRRGACSFRCKVTEPTDRAHETFRARRRRSTSARSPNYAISPRRDHIGSDPTDSIHASAAVWLSFCSVRSMKFVGLVRQRACRFVEFFSSSSFRDKFQCRGQRAPVRGCVNFRALLIS